MAYGWHLEAEYKDGYIHSEKELNDQSPYKETANIFNDILEKRPEVDHGLPVRFSLVGPVNRYDIDWTTLPDNARPIYYRDMQHERNVATGDSHIEMVMQHFGYQYTDENGENQQEIIDI